MVWFEYDILMIALLACIACALPGLLLVLQGTALLSDAISHSMLPGIVVMFLLVNNLQSPLLLFGAALAGLLTVVTTEYIIGTRRIKQDAAIGLVFPFFFSVGVLLITLYARHTHLDADMVVLGELAFAPFERIIWHGYDLGAYNLWSLALVAASTSGILYFFFTTFIMASFDAEQARLFGLRPHLFFYLIMCITSVTCVTCFETVGSLVVVSLMVTPAASALLTASRVNQLVPRTLLFAICSAVSGYAVAHLCDVSISGAIAVCNGLYFFYCWLFGPYQGIIALMNRRSHHHARLTQALLCDLVDPHGTRYEQLQQMTRWSNKQLDATLTQLITQNKLERCGDLIMPIYTTAE